MVVRIAVATVHTVVGYIAVMTAAEAANLMGVRKVATAVVHSPLVRRAVAVEVVYKTTAEAGLDPCTKINPRNSLDCRL